MIDINALSSREAMRLSETYVASPFDAFGDSALASTFFTSQGGSLDEKRFRLSREVEDPSQSLESRLASGALLGLLGDPRISALEPTLINVPASVVSVGTPFVDVHPITVYHSASNATHAGRSGKDHHGFSPDTVAELAARVGFTLSKCEMIPRSGPFASYLACEFRKCGPGESL
jgi:hypothetical protein